MITQKVNKEESIEYANTKYFTYIVIITRRLPVRPLTSFSPTIVFERSIP
ncbi:hypothetical protein H1P_1680023 [Hyella patelloides LEGE 07179]|uniref:Uncharacterized protein n=1 Tax=Hyella patelloides LEGE 07179 TaxID=945734 RepID=A0A563VN36_9CYAN|nr:hypothetical protein H1P_1680023 [Hyella patelloides LEGE 07179]